MGIPDIVLIPCPKCGTKYPAQSRGRDIGTDEKFDLSDCPKEVLVDADRHAPFQCNRCGSWFTIKLTVAVEVALVGAPDGPRPAS